MQDVLSRFNGDLQSSKLTVLPFIFVFFFDILFKPWNVEYLSLERFQLD